MPPILAELAREREIPSLALLEATDSDQGPQSSVLGVTEVLAKPVAPADVVSTARRLLRWRDMQERTGIVR